MQLADVLPRITDASGSPVVNGTVYFGQPNVDTRLNPVTVYQDPEFSTPLGTSLLLDGLGRYSFNGQHTPVHIQGTFSYEVYDAADQLVDQVPAVAGIPFDSSLFFGEPASGDMTAALNGAFQAAAGRTLTFTNPQTYPFSGQLIIPAGTAIHFNGTILETSGSDTSSANQLLVEDRVRMDWLRMNVPTGDTIRRMCAIDGDNVKVDRITITSEDQQDNDNVSPTTDAAFRVNGDNCVIGLLEIDNFDHAALVFQNSNCRIEGAVVTSFKRALKLDQSDGWYVDNFRCHTASPNAGAANRGNGILIEQCRYWQLSNATLANMHSHAIRIGGTTTNETHNGILSNINLYEFGRCGLKIKDGTNRIHDIMVNGIMATDGSFYTAGSENEDFIRLERCDNIHISGAQCKVDNTPRSAYYGVFLENVNDVQIDGLDIRDTISDGIRLGPDDVANIEGGSFGVYINGVIRDAGGNGVNLVGHSQNQGRLSFDVLCTGQTGHGYSTTLTSSTINQFIRLAGVVDNVGAGILNLDISDPDVLIEIEPALGVDTLTGPGAIAVGSRVTQLVTTGANALTLADGYLCQRKTITMITDGGAGTLTPTNLAGTPTTIVFDDVGDTAELKFLNGAWYFLGGTATLA